MRKIITILASAVFYIEAEAQKYPVIADMDTHFPLAGVSVAGNNGQRATTDYSGKFHTTLHITSATISKKHYMQRRVGATELQQDTLFLIPQEVVLNDIVVTSPGFSLDMQKAMQGIKDNAKLPNPNQGFNLLGIFQLLAPSKKTKAYGRAEKIKKILDNY